jgi:Tetratricopeptide repeat-like domain
LALTPTKDRAGSDEAFLREVDDAVRALVVIGLGAFAGYIFYQNAQKAAADKQSEVFIAAVDKLKAGDDKNARTELTKLVAAPQPGYNAMAQLLLANLDGEKGNEKAALATYKKVSSDSALPEPFRNLALIRQTAMAFGHCRQPVVRQRRRNDRFILYQIGQREFGWPHFRPNCQAGRCSRKPAQPCAANGGKLGRGCRSGW